MTESTCRTCRWHDIEGFQRYYREAAEAGVEMGGRGFCRRYPPMPDFTRLLLANQLEVNRREVFVFAFWPETAPEDWCGEWQVQERA